MITPALDSRGKRVGGQSACTKALSADLDAASSSPNPRKVEWWTARVHEDAFRGSEGSGGWSGEGWGRRMSERLRVSESERTAAVAVGAGWRGCRRHRQRSRRRRRADRRGDGCGLRPRRRSGGSGRSGQRARRRAGPKSAPRVARWLGDIRTYFPKPIVQVMQRDAIERLDLRQLLLEPELLESIEPDIHLVTMLVELNHLLPDETRATARQVDRPGPRRPRAAAHRPHPHRRPRRARSRQPHAPPPARRHRLATHGPRQPPPLPTASTARSSPSGSSATAVGSAASPRTS